MSTASLPSDLSRLLAFVRVRRGGRPRPPRLRTKGVVTRGGYKSRSRAAKWLLQTAGRSMNPIEITLQALDAAERAGQPLYMLNLLRYRAYARYEDGLDAAAWDWHVARGFSVFSRSPRRCERIGGGRTVWGQTVKKPCRTMKPFRHKQIPNDLISLVFRYPQGAPRTMATPVLFFSAVWPMSARVADSLATRTSSQVRPNLHPFYRHLADRALAVSR